MAVVPRLMAMRLATIIGFMMSVGPASAETPDTLNELLKYKTSRVSSQMKAVHERPADPRDRSVTLRVESDPARYVRCDFGADGVSLSCRVSPSQQRSSDRLAALARLGFVAEAPRHDLTYVRPMSGKPDFDEISRLMLTALHEAHGVEDETGLTIVAPYAGTLIFLCRY